MSFAPVYLLQQLASFFLDFFRHCYALLSFPFRKKSKRAGTIPGEIFFDDPRLRMGAAGRLLVRIFRWAAYLVFLAATVTLLISPLPGSRLFGVFFGLLFLDYFIHRRDGNLSIPELQGMHRANVARTMSPQAFAALEHAFDASVIAKKNFYLDLAKRLAEMAGGEAALRKLGVSAMHFKNKADEFSAEKTENTSRRALAEKSQQLALAAFREAALAGHAFIEPTDLFAGLTKLGDPSIDRTLNALGATDTRG